MLRRYLNFFLPMESHKLEFASTITIVASETQTFSTKLNAFFPSFKGNASMMIFIVKTMLKLN